MTFDYRIDLLMKRGKRKPPQLKLGRLSRYLQRTPKRFTPKRYFLQQVVGEQLAPHCVHLTQQVPHFPPVQQLSEPRA